VVPAWLSLLGAMLLTAAISPGAALAESPQPDPAAEASASSDLANLSLEQLMDVEVTSVSKKPQRIADVAAAIYVISQEDIRRSGMTSIAELLRTVPGLDVAQTDSQRWAVGSRGFNDIYSGKLLVLVDGRSVYAPTFSGVLWDTQDLPLQDIERIEVIRGPGGTIWGANAVNGVINIITKNARDTQGLTVTAGAGTEATGSGTIRYGGKLSDQAHFRIYLKGFDRSSFVTPTGADAGDSWRARRAGGRLDWTPSANDAVSAQVEYYGERKEGVVFPPSLVVLPTPTAQVQRTTGGHALVSWAHTFSAGSDLTFQAYFDNVAYQDTVGSATLNTYDVEVRHHVHLGSRHEVVWGGGFRRVDYQAQFNPYVTLIPPTGGEEVVNVFAQDEFTLSPTIHVIGGVKLEHNTYTGWEYEPSLRLLWTPATNHTVWAAVSRAIRMPSIGEEFLRFDAFGIPGSEFFPPLLISSFGNPGLQQSERLVSWEAGYRSALTSTLSVDLAAYYNRYTRLASTSVDTPFFELDPAPPHLVIPLRFSNLLEAEVHGFEASVNWQATRRWRLFAAYSLLLGKLSAADPSVDLTLQRNPIDSSPRHQVQLRSYLDLPGRMELDAALYHVSSLPAAFVPAYTRLDVRLGWKATDRLILSLSGQNLLQSRHQEFSPIVLAAPTEVPRTVYFTATAGF
jgi:iron complex outermembrane receptor protein